jgi:putative two-component system response regulator
VVVTDIRMPSISGMELLDQIRRFLPDIPIILMTGYAEMDTVISAVKKKAFDFITKPFSPEVLLEAVSRAMRENRAHFEQQQFRRMLEEAVSEKASELAKALNLVNGMSMEVIHRLTTAAECRDNDTGEHIIRIGEYARNLALTLQQDEDYAHRIKFAGQMHDIGKIGIPDSILLKAGPLSHEEFNIMKDHTLIGERILRGSKSPVLQMATAIAVSHHERWDGSGYPHGLSEEAIPLEGRIIFLCDQYDALRSKRPYKDEFSHERCCSIILDGDGRSMPHFFDPQVLDAFASTRSGFDDIFNRYRS